MYTLSLEMGAQYKIKYNDTGHDKNRKKTYKGTNLINHNLRNLIEENKNKIYKNENIDKEKSEYNLNYYQDENGNLQFINNINEFYERLYNRLDKVDTSKKPIRQDAVALRSIVIQVGNMDDNPFLNDDKDDQRKMIYGISDFLSKNFDSENVISMSLHLDETTPHIHAFVCPVTQDGRLSQKDYFGKNSSGFSKIRNSFKKTMQDHSLDVNVEKINTVERKHLNEAEFREFKIKESNIKYKTDLLDMRESDLKRLQDDFEIKMSNKSKKLDLKEQELNKRELDISKRERALKQDEINLNNVRKNFFREHQEALDRLNEAESVISEADLKIQELKLREKKFNEKFEWAKAVINKHDEIKKDKSINQKAREFNSTNEKLKQNIEDQKVLKQSKKHSNSNYVAPIFRNGGYYNNDYDDFSL